MRVEISYSHVSLILLLSMLLTGYVIGTMTTTVSGLEVENNYTLYVYGWRPCPHCHDLANYIIENNMNFTWFWIEEEVNNNLLKRLATDYDFQAGTPTVVLVVNGKPEAIVIGAVLEDNFWERLINNPNGKLEVYIGTSLKSVNIARVTFFDDYLSGVPTTYEDVLEYSGKGRPFYIFEYLPTIVLLLVISSVTIAFLWRRKG